jgi:hypothetical protein
MERPTLWPTARSIGQTTSTSWPPRGVNGSPGSRLNGPTCKTRWPTPSLRRWSPWRRARAITCWHPPMAGWPQAGCWSTPHIAAPRPSGAWSNTGAHSAGLQPRPVNISAARPWPISPRPSTPSRPLDAGDRPPPATRAPSSRGRAPTGGDARAQAPHRRETEATRRAVEQAEALRASEAQLRLVVVRADRRTLHQIIVNLTNNATKFTDRGSVQLELCQGEEERQRWV